MNRNDLLGWGLSIGLHILVLLMIGVYHEITEDEEIPIGYVAVEIGDYSEGRPVRQVAPARPTPTPPQPEEQDEEPRPERTPPQQETPQPNPQQQQEVDPEPVNLPEQTLPNDDTEAVTEPDTKPQATEQPEPSTDNATTTVEPAQQATPPAEPQPLGSGQIGGDTGANSGDDGTGSDETEAAPFDIEGLNRTPLSTPLPRYTSQVNAVISFIIEVNPRGEIVRKIPARKGDPALERAVLQVLDRWRFNALPANAPQVNQRGTVTFRFRLE
ncbi:MAG: energy transducer TonB [Bacteroidota bacterium]